jgi:putative salt-induced outer membrane protein YdiY
MWRVEPMTSLVSNGNWIRKSFVFVVLILVQAESAFAQPPAAADQPPPRLEASAQFAFLDTSGNASSQSLGAGGDLTWRPDPWTYLTKMTFAQAESDEELSARSFATLFRASRALNQRLSAYGQYDFLRDVFAGVDERHVIEGGLSYLAVNRAPHRLRLDAGLGYLHESRPDEDLDSATLSLAARYRLAISSTAEFIYEPRFLLPISETDAWKFDQDVALVVGLNSFLSLKLAHTLRYSADPPTGFDTTDRIMAVSLVAKVRRPQP